MLQAQTLNGQLVVLATYTKKEIEYLRNTEKFICPTCRRKVLIKAGEKVTPHFAHVSLQNCPANEKGESPEHKRGKLLLYKWLRRQRIHVELEKYLKDINQQPDLLLTIQQKKIAIEYQCTRISIEHIQRRNKGYQQAGITPIWILGPKQFYKRSTYEVKVDEFAKQFIHQFSPSCIPTIYFFCPWTKRFVFFQDIFFTSLTNAIGKLQFHSLTHVHFRHFFQYERFSRVKLYQLWYKKKKFFRLRRHGLISGKTRKWVEWLYERRMHWETLPSAIFLPVEHHVHMKSPLWDWQSRLCIDFLHRLSHGHLFTIKDCYQFLQKHIQQKTYFPLLYSSKTALYEYLQLLTELDIIHRLSSQTFIKKNDLKFPKNIEEALKSDKILMNEMIQNIKTKQGKTG